MSGFSDGSSKVWIVERDGALKIDGFRAYAEALSHIVRTALAKAAIKQPSQVNAVKHDLRREFEAAFAHLDEDDE